MALLNKNRFILCSLLLVFLFSVDCFSQIPSTIHKIAIIYGTSNSRLPNLTKKIKKNIKSNNLKFKFYEVELDDISQNFYPAIDNLRQISPDIIITLGSWSTDLVSRYFPNTPIVFTLVYETDAIYPILEQNQNISGCFLNIEFEKILACLSQFPELNKIGIIYGKYYKNTISKLMSHFNSINGGRFDYRLSFATNEKELGIAYNKISQFMDLFLLLPDPMMLNEPILQNLTLGQITKNYLVVSEYVPLAKTINAITFTFYEEEIVQKITQLTVDTLTHKKKSSEPVYLKCKQFYLILNDKALKHLNFTIPDVIKNKKNQYIP